MRSKITLALAGSLVLLTACGGSSNSDRAAPTPQNTNNNGTPVNGVLTACFDPANANANGHPCRGSVPLPNNLLLSGTTDLTLNPPVTDPNNYADPYVAISSLDGWGTSGPLSMKFNAKPAANSIVPGQSVRIFQVSLTGNDDRFLGRRRGSVLSQSWRSRSGHGERCEQQSHRRVP